MCNTFPTCCFTFNSFSLFCCWHKVEGEWTSPAVSNSAGLTLTHHSHFAPSCCVFHFMETNRRMWVCIPHLGKYLQWPAHVQGQLSKEKFVMFDCDWINTHIHIHTQTQAAEHGYLSHPQEVRQPTAWTHLQPSPSCPPSHSNDAAPWQPNSTVSINLTHFL